MPNASKSAGQTSPEKPGALAFEEALKKLESIVDAMESEDLPLESLLAKIQAPPLVEIADMKTQRDVALGLEQLADSPAVQA